MDMVSCLSKWVKSEGTKFSVPEGLLLALIGFVLVITVLIVLMGVIYGLSAIVRKFEGKTSTAKVAQTSGGEAPLAPGSSGNVKLNNVSEPTAAMIMAIVADELGTPLNELRFISIKEVEENK